MTAEPPAERVPRQLDVAPAGAPVPLTAPEADELHARLLRDLAHLEALLVQHDPSGYPATWARRVRRDLVNRDAGGLDRLLGAYAGAGSFSDLVLPDGPMGELDALRSRIGDDARTLRDDLRHG